MQGSLAQNSVRWSVFEDQTEGEGQKGIEDAAKGTGVKATRMKQWSDEWEDFCEWVVAEFGDKH